jgi:BirA family biotin operon repressor/biotin-[acetyl-CoA-carboxylase] ligase
LKSNQTDLADVIARARTRLGDLAVPFHHFATIGSTNDAALELGVEGAVVVADAQTSGRGRRGHVWFSPPMSGLYVSVVLAPARARVDPNRAASLLTLAAGVAIAEGIEIAAGLRAELKWPNDLQVRSRKLAGILAETARDSARSVLNSGERVTASASGGSGFAPSIVLGYGINITADAYPSDLRERATSIASETGRPIDRAVVLVETLSALASRYADLLTGRFDAILDAWRVRAPQAVGAAVEWTTPDGTRTGVTHGIDADGALRVQTDAGVERILGGEVRWLGLADQK